MVLLNVLFVFEEVLQLTYMSFDFLLVELFGELANAAVKVAIGILVHVVLRKSGYPRYNIGIPLLLLANTTENVVHGLLYHLVAIQRNIVCSGEPQV